MHSQNTSFFTTLAVRLSSPPTTATHPNSEWQPSVRAKRPLLPQNLLQQLRPCLRPPVHSQKSRPCGHMLRTPTQAKGTRELTAMMSTTSTGSMASRHLSPTLCQVGWLLVYSALSRFLLSSSYENKKLDLIINTNACSEPHHRLSDVLQDPQVVGHQCAGVGCC